MCKSTELLRHKTPDFTPDVASRQTRLLRVLQERVYQKQQGTSNISDELWLLTFRGEGNLHPRRPPREYLSEYTSRGKPKIPPADRILMDPSRKARKNTSDNADLGFQAVGPALRIMQLNVEGL